ncbi:hypothetical protein TanjilG_23152 [Lupinus angustifolius]|uniref:Uncharacterized protein n=1 Tax=Lupinus angustifolius TaxID=3871 RepID=A0A1J7IDH8_LUPAN|nr:hypothetical protein TanjilG_23150 [Lupinus angustifolius]OIW16650.1 hypothetical protein TanjilG_23152 [Lupinus angustifolius]
MAVSQDQFEIKFRLSDGSNIAPKGYPSIATLKESNLAQMAKRQGVIPKTYEHKRGEACALPQHHGSSLCHHDGVTSNSRLKHTARTVRK